MLVFLISTFGPVQWPGWDASFLGFRFRDIRKVVWPFLPFTAGFFAHTVRAFAVWQLSHNGQRAASSLPCPRFLRVPELLVWV